MEAKNSKTTNVLRSRTVLLAIGLTVCMSRVRAQDTASPRPSTPLPAAQPMPPAPLVTQGVTFAPLMQFEKGQTRRYATQFSMTLRIPGPNGTVSPFASSPSLSTVLRYRVRDAKPDGSAQVSVMSEGGRLLDTSGAFQDIPKETDNSAKLLTLDRQSHLVAFKDQTKGRASDLDALFTQSNLFVPLHILPLPEKTVHVGERWTARYASPGKILRANEALSDPEQEISATLTLLGSEKIGAVDTIKIKQVLTVPYIAYADAQGKPSDATHAKGRMTIQLTFTELLNALPQDGLMVRSEGVITGTITFEGALLSQVPGGQMTISGKFVAVRLDDDPKG